MADCVRSKTARNATALRRWCQEVKARHLLHLALLRGLQRVVQIKVVLQGRWQLR